MKTKKLVYFEVHVESSFQRFCFVVGMIVIDKNGNIAGGTSTNGASHKIPGYETRY